jgi:hypothetical protein
MKMLKSTDSGRLYSLSSKSLYSSRSTESTLCGAAVEGTGGKGLVSCGCGCGRWKGSRGALATQAATDHRATPHAALTLAH